MTQPNQPDIIIVMTDQQRGDCLGIDGHPCLQTPNMDHLAYRGTRFRHGYTTCPSCIPARRAMMSGMFPQHSGVVGFLDNVRWNHDISMAGEMKKAGYQTVLIGRTMHQHPRHERLGFDEMICDAYNHFVESHQPLGTGGAYAHGIDGNGWGARPWHMDERYHYTYWAMTEAQQWLRDKRDPNRPLFLIVSLIAPHPPLVPPAFYMDRYLRMDLPEPAIGDWAVEPPNDGIGLDTADSQCKLTGERLRACRAGYYGLINHIDDQMSRVVGYSTTGPRRNLVTIFTSDHGEMLGDHHLFRKCYPYEASTRVPFIISATPDLGFKEGNVVEEAVCLEDLMPTVLDLAGAPIPDQCDGRSLVPFLHGQTPTWRDYLHGEHALCYRKEVCNHWLSDGHQKYIWLTYEGREQLFDLDHDANECHDLSKDPAWADRLQLWRGRMIDELRDRPEGFVKNNELVGGVVFHPLMPHAQHLLEKEAWAGHF